MMHTKVKLQHTWSTHTLTGLYTLVHSSSHQPTLNECTKTTHTHTHCTSGALISVPCYSPQFNGTWTHIHQTIHKGVYTMTHAHTHAISKVSEAKVAGAHADTQTTHKNPKAQNWKAHFHTLYITACSRIWLHTHTHTRHHTPSHAHARTGQFIFSIPRSGLTLLHNNENKLSVYFALFSHEYFIYFPIWGIWWCFFSWGISNNLNNLTLREFQF